MFYYLSYLSTNPDLGFFRLFNYVSFRAGCAGAMAFLIVILLGPATVRMLKKFRATAPSRYGGVVEEFVNVQKDKTPSMGGVLIILGITAAAILWMKPLELTAILVGSTILLGLLGFADDFAKVAYRRRDGIPGKVKLLGQFLVAAAAVVWLYYIPEFAPYMRNLYIPFVHAPVAVGVWVSIVAVGAIMGASNAVNLTDGKDGLSTGCMIFATIAYAVMAYLCGHRVFAEYLLIPFIPGAGSDRCMYRISLAQLPPGNYVYGRYRQSGTGGDHRFVIGAGAAGISALFSGRSFCYGNCFGNDPGAGIQTHRQTGISLYAHTPPL